MLEYKMRFITASVAILLSVCCEAAVCAETWQLERGGELKGVSAQGQDGYRQAVAQIKQLVNTGQTSAVRKALDKLKKDFPEIAGPDLDAFIAAELLFCKGKFPKAARSYEKFTTDFPQSELYQAALDRQFEIATAYLAGQKISVLGIFRIKGYDTGVKIMEKITDRAGELPIGLKAAVAVAESYEKRGKFSEAYQKWSEISSRWPTGQMGRDALLSMARCKHAAYRGPRYDSSDLVSAKSYYGNFRLRYPDTANQEIDIDKKLNQIEEQSAYKQFSIGRYYQKTGNIESANLYYQMVVGNWPQTTAAKMAQAAMNEKPDDRKEQRWGTKIIRKLEKWLL